MIRLLSFKRIFYASNGITSKIIDMVNDNSTNLTPVFIKSSEKFGCSRNLLYLCNWNNIPRSSPIAE